MARDFCRCGIAGWCLEILFTASDSLWIGDWKLMGKTSLLMFPIYGLGALLRPIEETADRWLGETEAFFGGGTKPGRILRHGLIDMILIFTAEYLIGSGLKALGICPWDYSVFPDNIHGVIRLAFAPLWFGTGLLLEWIAAGNDRGSASVS